ncbi:MAG: hypothetical protein E7559_02675 [Ruminococcaceae bacterium]|nr:hypothetical protein [Oscillospiraceae bacterium]
MTDMILDRIRRMRTLLAETKKQEVSMRFRLNLYWLSMLVALIAALLLVLSVTGVFSDSQRKLGSTLDLQQQNTADRIARHTDTLTAQGISLSNMLSDELSGFLSDGNLTFDDLNNSPELIAEAEERLYYVMDTTLRTAECSGVYFILDVTANTGLETSGHSRAGLYLRYSDLSGVNSADKHTVLFRGSPQVARSKNVEMHNRWNLEFDTTLIPSYDTVINSPVDRLADGCMWTKRMPLKDTWESAMLLCVPIIDQSGAVRGMCGMELSDLYFRLSYVSSHSTYGSTLTVLTPCEEYNINLGDAMIGHSEDVYLSTDGIMSISHGKYYNTYSIEGECYLGQHRHLAVHTHDDKPLAVLTLLPESSYSRSARTSRFFWTVGFLAFFLISLGTSFYFSKIFVRPITNMLDSIQQDTVDEDQQSGIQEIDQLLRFIRERTQKQTDGGLPPNIEKLFTAFTARVSTLTSTERTILQYYIDGYDINSIAEMAFISVNTVKKHNTNINRKLELSTREELLLYIDLYRRCGRIDEISNTAKPSQEE